VKTPGRASNRMRAMGRQVLSARMLVGHEEPTYIYRQLLRPTDTEDRGKVSQS